jgi:hypothetical protein
MSTLLEQIGSCAFAAVLVLSAACASDSDVFFSGGGGEAQGGSTSSTNVGGSSTGGGSGGTSSGCDDDCSLNAAPTCELSVCNEQSGQCELVDAVDGASCDDGQFCTIGDVCMAGSCQGAPNDCGMDAACTVPSCDEDNDTCTTTPKQNGLACQLPDLCILGPTCQGGVCSGGTLNTCDFVPVPGDCFVALCNSTNGMCEAVAGNNGQICVDPNDLCTVGKTCSAGVCQGGSPKSCSQLDVGCMVGACNTNTGQCVSQNAPNNTSCDDLNGCTTGEVCTSGSCGGGSPIQACVNNDGCCPNNCTVNNDTDCLLLGLDIGSHNTTLFSADETRGFWFTAPVSFTIQELRVPTAVGTGDQNIQVVRFTNPPPFFPTTTTAHTTLALFQAVPGTSFIQANIQVLQGDHIGIIGARGDGLQMRSSYGASNSYNTTILGQPVTLNRLIYQDNLALFAAGALSGHNNNFYGRIEVNYSL